jgi:ABC-type Fe3+/spermidine/putrescine transport system ATPase subunit
MTGTSEDPVLEIRGVSKLYGRKSVLSDVSLTIYRGEFLSIIGPSGSGKSTILKLVVGTVKPTKGHILLRGEDIATLGPERLRMVMVWQSLGLFPHMDVGDNVGFGLAIRRVSRRDLRTRVAQYLEMVGLQGFERRRIDELSGGEQQRVAIARALIVEPQVLLLDEPMGGLDKHRRAQMLSKFREIHRLTGVTIVMVTHDQAEAMVTSGRLAVLNDGAIHQVGAPYEINNQPKTAFVAQFVGHKNVLPAVVVNANGPRLTVKSHAETLSGQAPRWISHDFQPGDEVVYVEVVYVIDAYKVSFATNGDNSVNGHVDVRSVSGGTEVVELVVPGLATLRCERSVSSSIESELPDPVNLSWSAEDAYVLPR